MTFETLLQLVQSNADPGICTDSRHIQTGDIFVAVRGTQVDGHNFIQQALIRGAAYIVCENTQPNTHNIPRIVVPDARQAAAQLAQTRYDFPGQKLINLAVTGTNGKTTVATLTQRCLQAAGRPCGLVSTIHYDTGGGIIPAPLTTPDALTLVKLQAEMVQHGCTHMVTEASSHALDQGRLTGIDFHSAAFTNLTGDHLDYHQTEAAYLAAKATLFEGLAPEAWAILNTDAPHSQELIQRTSAQIIGYGINTEAALQARIQSTRAAGTVYDLCYQGQCHRVRSPLPGRHNVSNHLAAAGLCLAGGLSLEAVASGLETAGLVTGRLEPVPWDGPFSVLVDYAHTDDALRNVLTTLRPLCHSRLIVVFGCGGDRDRSKRPRMAQVTAQWADRAIVTSDNPRTEDPQRIIDDIVAGVPDPSPCDFSIEPDRRQAIAQAIAQAQDDDIVLIAGKGHETYQIIGSERLDFSDRDVAWACLQERSHS